MGLTPTPPVTAASAETLLEFPDNRLLIDLCGPNDRHLARIEEALGVHILRRGNQIAVVGGPEAQSEAANLPSPSEPGVAACTRRTSPALTR